MTLTIVPPGTTSEDSSSALVYKTGGHEYPMYSEPRCKTCQSPYRTEIENRILKGISYRNIVDGLGEQSSLSVENIRHHVAKKHLPVEEEVKRIIMHEQAKAIGLDPEETERAIVDGLAFAKVGLQTVHQAMTAGELQPTVAEGIAFAKFIHEMENYGGEDMDREAFGLGLRTLIELIKKNMNSEQFASFSLDVRSDPLLASLIGISPVSKPEQAAIPATSREV